MDVNQEYLVQCRAINLPKIKETLNRGAELNVKNGNCLVAIIKGLGTSKDKITTLDYLLVQGAKLNSTGETLLSLAIEEKNKELVKYFLLKGVKPNDDDGIGIYTAMKNNDKDILSHLFAHGGVINKEVQEYFEFEKVEMPNCIKEFIIIQNFLIATPNLSTIDSQQAAINYSYSKHDDCGEMLPNKLVVELDTT